MRLGARRILFVINPVAGKGGLPLARRVASLLDERGARVAIRTTLVRGDAERLARDAASDGCAVDQRYDTVAVVGGDGTINEVANGLLGSDIALVIVPTGTANVLARDLELNSDATDLCRTILEGRTMRFHPGVVGDRSFVAMVSAGFDARVVAAVDLALKIRLGKGAYVLAVLALLFRRHRPLYRVIVDNRVFDAAWVVVTKTRHYAGGYVIAPNARLGERGYWVFLLTDPSRCALIFTIVGIAMGRVTALRRATLVKGNTISIHHLGAVIANADVFQADGDLAGKLPAFITVGEKSLKILY
jgi:YegS/Rv2252/BmrU family lipid kinase